MGIQDWRRIREQAAKEPPIPHASNAWAPLVGAPDDAGDAATEVGGAEGDDAADTTKVEEYFAWAERLKAKKLRNQQDQRDPAPSDAEPSYWSTDAVFAESRRVEHEEAASGRPTAATDEAYAVLGLGRGASDAAITEAYRRLAKLHHPDHVAAADAATRRRHADQMLAINDAYRVLRAAHGP